MIDPDKIREVIGTGGKVINDIIARCDNVKIDIEDSGQVTIYHMDRETINKAKVSFLISLEKPKLAKNSSVKSLELKTMVHSSTYSVMSMVSAMSLD